MNLIASLQQTVKKMFSTMFTFYIVLKSNVNGKTVKMKEKHTPQYIEKILNEA